MASLVDVNVLLALLHARHQHHPRALAWLNTCDSAGAVKVCRVVQMGVLRLLTRTAVMREDVLSAAEFWEGWARLMDDDRLAWVQEPLDTEEAWRRVTSVLPKRQCAETDAYLAALARAGDWTLVTFDQGFRRFAGLRTEILT